MATRVFPSRVDDTAPTSARAAALHLPFSVHNRHLSTTPSSPLPSLAKVEPRSTYSTLTSTSMQSILRLTTHPYPHLENAKPNFNVNPNARRHRVPTLRSRGLWTPDVTSDRNTRSTKPHLHGMNSMATKRFVDSAHTITSTPSMQTPTPEPYPTRQNAVPKTGAHAAHRRQTRPTSCCRERAVPAERTGTLGRREGRYAKSTAIGDPTLCKAR